VVFSLRKCSKSVLIDDARSVSGAVATLWSCAREQLLSMAGSAVVDHRSAISCLRSASEGGGDVQEDQS